MDSQTLMVRRTIALGGGILLIVLIVLGLNSCLDNRKDRAFRDYASDVRAIVRGSNDISESFFDLLSSPQRADALDVQTQVNAQRADAEQLVQRARDTDHPDELDGAHGWLVEALQFRADAIERIAAQLPAALGDQRGSSDAVNAIAGQMQALLASDVIYLQRTIPRLLSAYDERGIEERFPTDRFLPDLGWLDPDTVQTRLSRIAGEDSRTATPGLHGTGIQTATVRPADVELTESGVNRVPVSDQLTFDVTVQNQGESEETDLGVSVSITNGERINVDQTIPRIAAGESETVSIPIQQAPSTEAVSTVTVAVDPVPGEGTRENNRIQYQVAFTAE
ncbi:MAG TPA: CARDB domain-containing protein [Solirubrobacterales bacterium]|nr:CARDB domain-containing protein [Solirubrobacterales bacterium]